MRGGGLPMGAGPRMSLCSSSGSCWPQLQWHFAAAVADGAASAVAVAATAAPATPRPLPAVSCATDPRSRCDMEYGL